MHPDLLDLVMRHRLAPAVVHDLDAFVERVLGGSSARTLAADGPGGPTDPVDGDTRVGDPTPDAPAERQTIPARYEDVGRIGAGGMGEVRRVHDRELRRTVAYKVIRAELLSRPAVMARFAEEAQIGAQLQHPNIPPVYDGGRLADGRPWFTMKEVRGRTFREVIREAHGSEVTDATLRRLCDVLAKVCDGVGYAHVRGVVHRDIKPDNVMVGSHGEVFVLDWGLAKVVGRPDRALQAGDLEPEVATGRAADDSLRTRVGGVLGTAAYMPPEQARGEVDRLDARADVYALGAMLYEVLSGRPPYEGRDAHAVRRQVLAGPPEPPGRVAAPAEGMTFTFGVEALESEVAGPRLPEELVSLSMGCLSREPADRPADGAAVGAALRAWLDGASKRAKALEVVAAADAVVESAATLRELAAAWRAEGEAMLAPCEPWAPEAEKVAGWAKQDEAERVAREAVMLELKREALLRGALTHAPDLAEAHAALVELERSRHAAAEGARDESGAARAEVRVREHADALPDGHPTRAWARAYLKGDGALSLESDRLRTPGHRSRRSALMLAYRAEDAVDRRRDSHMPDSRGASSSGARSATSPRRASPTIGTPIVSAVSRPWRSSMPSHVARLSNGNRDRFGLAGVQPASAERLDDLHTRRAHHAQPRSAPGTGRTSGSSVAKFGGWFLWGTGRRMACATPAAAPPPGCASAGQESGSVVVVGGCFGGSVFGLQAVAGSWAHECGKLPQAS